MRSDAADRRSIGVIRGDGIGPELVACALEVLEASRQSGDVRLDFIDEPGGAATFRESGRVLPEGAINRIRDVYGAVLKGPSGLPDVRNSDGTEAGVLGGVLRVGLDTYANVRPMRLLAGVEAPTKFKPGDVDYVIVRENTEGLYISRGAGIVNGNLACDQLLVTRDGVHRVARFAFELARSRNGAPVDGVQRVTCVDKSNVLRSYALFRAAFAEIAAEFPDIEADYRYADAAAHDLIMTPQHFDVVVTENFIGDILSDVGAATVGGLGMCAAGNVGADSAYFEPVHGSAPTLAGTDRANPTSQILAAAMMLDYLGAASWGTRVREAVEFAYASGDVKLGADGCPIGGTRAMTDAVIRIIRMSNRN